MNRPWCRNKGNHQLDGLSRGHSISHSLQQGMVHRGHSLLLYQSHRSQGKPPTRRPEVPVPATSPRVFFYPPQSSASAFGARFSPRSAGRRCSPGARTWIRWPAPLASQGALGGAAPLASSRVESDETRIRVPNDARKTTRRRKIGSCWPDCKLNIDS